MDRYEVRWVSTNNRWQIRQSVPMGGITIVDTRNDYGWGISFRHGSATLDQIGGSKIPAYVLNAAETVWRTCR